MDLKLIKRIISGRSNLIWYQVSHLKGSKGQNLEAKDLSFAAERSKTHELYLLGELTRSLSLLGAQMSRQLLGKGGPAPVHHPLPRREGGTQLTQRPRCSFTAWKTQHTLDATTQLCVQ